MAHEFLGPDVEGKDVIIIDDMISSGDSMLEVAKELKQRKARKVFSSAPPSVSSPTALRNLTRHYENGVIDRAADHQSGLSDAGAFIAALLYRCCDMSKYIALLIDTLNHDVSISDLLNPY